MAGEPQPDLSGTRAERAAAAGLSGENVAEIDSAGITAYVPVMPAGWTVQDVFTERDGDGPVLPNYTITYRSPAGACVFVNAASEGLGGVFVAEPPNERAVFVPGVPMDEPARLGWATAADSTVEWGAGLVQTEWFGRGMPQLGVSTGTDEGCQYASPDEVEAVLKTLRPLDPDDDVLLN